MDNIIDQIKATTLFGQLDAETIRNCLESGEFKIVSYAKNAVIHFEAETANKLEVVLNGKVAVEHIDESGELLSITELFHNDILGGNLLFSEHPVYPMTITAQLPTVVLAVEREALFRLLSENPDFLKLYLSSISGRTQIL
ncbi:MAG: cyclic nucleotide-binding domain-containing protein, partial [Ruminococcaceae bacterium]|nr:cyclic nucleotide-binding domain-containing protein [Oscillospiraceae bacterium]